MIRREYNIGDYDLDTDIGMYLSQMAFFHGEGCLVGAMNKVAGYLDASGKQESASDKILVVASALGTPFYWQEFTKEWLAWLREKEYPIEPGKTNPTFHTSPFHHGNYPFREKFGWSEDRKQELYDGLIKIIKKRTEFSAVTAVDLDDYRQFLAKNPGVKHMWQSAGGFAFAMCMWRCREWAEAHNYQESIPYIYDRNDKFADAMKEEYDHICKDAERAKWWYAKPNGLHDGDKETYVPIQAVDVIAWEAARHYKDAHATANPTEFNVRHALVELSAIGAQFFAYGYEDFVTFWEERKESWIEEVREDMKRRGVIKTDKEFDEEYARRIVGMTKEELGQLEDK